MEKKEIQNSNSLLKNDSKSLYLLIIWEKSRYKTDSILNDIKKKFVIKKIYEIEWDEKEFVDNLTRIYGSKSTASDKAELFGTGPFLLIVVSDNNPKFIEQDTFKGVDIINTNILKSKFEYRKWIGEKFSVHGTVSYKETNHNLTLLFGKNIEEFKKELPEKWNGDIERIKPKLIGSDGWKNMAHLIYALNGTNHYVILRNFEELPEKFQQKDLDILTENTLMKYIIDFDCSLNVKENHFFEKNVGEKNIKFDLKYSSENYFDKKWAKNIIKKRILHTNGFYIPNTEDHFYTLLYHVIYQKKVIAEKYKKRLSNLAEELKLKSISYSFFNDFEKSKEILDKYLKENGYCNTTSFQFKLFHNEFLRLVKTSINFAKTEGISVLFGAIKMKLHMSFFKNP